ncbi:P-loop NTPase fold protein [Blastomonas sp. AAP25]|uniref:P-loop NTPase fold protein n=1 Tax=Blastomonas sp. AAP25 TaxID=1523416 RepID=UPI0018D15DFF|nr:P-loop NTPase fold protein [Blastomonas sp. AAP25]
MKPDTRSDEMGIRANNSISKFIEYYIEPERRFDYAVMIDGPWGSGKTHLVKEFVKNSTVNSLYITLNGVSSTDQIDAEIYRQLHPILSGKGMRILGAVSRAVAKGAFKMDFSDGNSATLNASLTEIDISKELSNPGKRLLVFDDLERCKIPVGEALGYINSFVEHDGLKVIILGNEAEIKDDGDMTYRQIKEKLVGQTLKVSSPAGEAFEVFAELVRHPPTRGFLKRHKENVLALHRQGGRGNLRTLKHAMWDFEKIGSLLETRHWNKQASVLKIMNVAMVCTMEARAGVLDADVLNSLIDNAVARAMRLQAKKPKNRADEIDDRYPQINFSDTLLTAQMLGSTLLEGQINGPGLVAVLDASADYAAPGDSPLWKQASALFFADDETSERVTHELEEAFASHQFTLRGEILHVAGIRLWLAKIGMIPKEIDEVVDECKAYIDHVGRAAQLETSLDRPNEHGGRNIYGGYMMVQSNTPEWLSIAAHYDEVELTVAKEKYGSIARDLLEVLPTDPDEFLFDLAVNGVRRARYSEHPVLMSIPAKEFATVIFEASPEIQARAFATLQNRHAGRSIPSLLPERLWIAEVKNELEKLIVAAKPMTRYRLNQLIEEHLDPLFAD